MIKLKDKEDGKVTTVFTNCKNYYINKRKYTQVAKLSFSEENILNIRGQIIDAVFLIEPCCLKVKDSILLRLR